jgi:L-fuculose-phosphate aldolase
MTETELREQMCLIGQQMHRKGYVDGAGGNISARLNSEHILTTPSGIAKGFMTPDQMIVVDMNGKRVDTKAHPHLRPTSEIIMHLECYRQRPDVQGVVHAHPPTAIALSIAGHSFTELLIPEVVILMGIVPTLPYATPASEENRNTIGESISQHDVLMLAYHGSLTVAKTLWDAYLRLENLEHTAKILYMVHQLGGAKASIPTEQVERLIDIRERLGLLRANEREILMNLSIT